MSKRPYEFVSGSTSISIPDWESDGESDRDNSFTELHSLSTMLSPWQCEMNDVEELMIACLRNSRRQVQKVLARNGNGGEEWTNIIEIALTITTRLGHVQATAALMHSIQDEKAKLYFQPKQKDQSLFENALFMQDWALADVLLEVGTRCRLNFKDIFKIRQRDGFGNVLGFATFRRLGYCSRQQNLVRRLIKMGANCRTSEMLEEEDPLHNAIVAGSIPIVKSIVKHVPQVPAKTVGSADAACDRAGEIVTIVENARRDWLSIQEAKPHRNDSKRLKLGDN
ncbi:hypothetical protein EK21DRAFT_95198 [Setomelanomma holmii]|uniref:Uncharacterized protein n=1 Tax=Setomelanomma holmii TaxID=210430 RepID=A0A9P4GXS0_9PLEO|nr:hypothetical protein EK21DRAFT_95198 [Setomelanomma holmii]